MKREIRFIMKIVLALLCLLIVLSPLRAQTAPDPGEVTRSFVQKMDHYGALQALRAIESVSRGSRAAQNLYDTYLANLYAFNGMIDSAAIAYYQSLYGYPLRTDAPAQSEEADYSGIRAVDAKKYILDYASTSRVVMLNEAHTWPPGRLFAKSLLGGLYERGYRYLCLEGLAYRPEPYADIAAAADPTAGYYTAESSFGELIRQALRLGYTVYGYDDYGRNRDSLQAVHIDELVFRRDPQARALILAGHGHISNRGNTLYRYLKQATGLDYIAFDQDIQREKPAPAYESALYRDYFRPLGLSTPAVLVDDSGSLFPIEGDRDVYLFTPPTQTVHGRPHWLSENGLRKAVPIEIDRPTIVKAYYATEADAVPEDGRLLVPPADLLVVEAVDGETEYCLILPPGRYRIQHWSPEGVLTEQYEKEVE